MNKLRSLSPLTGVAGMTCVGLLMSACSDGALVRNNTPAETNDNGLLEVPHEQNQKEYEATVGQQRSLIERQARVISALERRVNELERETGAYGTGAYRGGPRLNLDEQADQTVLDRIHDLRTKLSSAESTLGTNRKEIADMRRKLLATETMNGELNF